jgi:hypothetical protein
MEVRMPVLASMAYMDTLPKMASQPSFATYANSPFGSTAIEVGNTPPAVIVNVAVLELPPPGAGLKTVTVAVPTVEMSLTEI